MNLAEKFHALKPEQRKSLLLLLAVLAALAIIFMPSASDLQRAIPEPVRRFYPGDRPARPRKPSPYDGRPNTGAPHTPVPQPPDVAAGLPTPGALLGSYSGRGLLPRRGVCMLSVELRGQTSEAGPVVAYPTLQCTNLSMLVPGARGRGAKPLTPEEVMAAAGPLSPVSWVLNGSWQGGEIKLHIAKTIGAGDGCALSSATVTPFGMRQIAFEGQDTGCGNWQMLLARVGP